MYGIHFSRPRARSPCATATICFGHLVRKDTLPHETPNPPRARIFAFVLCFLALACCAPQARAQQGTLEGTTKISVDGGTLSYQTYFYSANCGPGGYFNQTTYTNFTFVIGGVTFPLGAQQVVAQGFVSNSCPNFTEPSSIPITLPNTNNSIVPAGECVYTFSNGGGSSTCPQLQTSVFDPNYKLVSIVYDPPGNKSEQYYGTLLTDASTTTIGNSFTFSDQITYTVGFNFGLSAGGTFGITSTSSDSTAHTETLQNTQSLGADANASLNPTGKDGKNPSDEMNHELDVFNIWLNPEVDVVATTDGIPVSYGLTLQSVQSVDSPQPDILSVPAIYLEPDPSNPTTPLAPRVYLEQQEFYGINISYYEPGLAILCKNLNKTEYANGTCTHADKCGCTPSDFSSILIRDPLLRYNPTTFKDNPVPGTESPVDVDVSGPSVCGNLNGDIAGGSYNCRYIPVPDPKDTSRQSTMTLSGVAPDLETVQDIATSLLTTGTSSSYDVGLTIKSGFIAGSLKQQQTWTWTDFQSIGLSSGEGNTMKVLLKTNTSGCLSHISIYEDKKYHTYVFQGDTGDTGCN